MPLFGAPSGKLLQIILSGQSDLAAKRAAPAAKRLRQRILIVCRLEPFGVSDTASYIEHRVALAGPAGESPFTRMASQ